MCCLAGSLLTFGRPAKVHSGSNRDLSRRTPLAYVTSNLARYQCSTIGFGEVPAQGPLSEPGWFGASEGTSVLDCLVPEPEPQLTARFARSVFGLALEPPQNRRKVGMTPAARVGPSKDR